MDAPAYMAAAALPDSARAAFAAAEAAMSRAGRTFHARFTTAPKLDEAIALLAEVEAQVHAARVLIRQARAETRRAG